MQIKAFMLLVPLEVALVKIQLFLFFPSGTFWEEEEDERGQTYLYKRKKGMQKPWPLSQTYLSYYSVSQS